jgi:RNA polymerase sigma factor (sigma-70 family)
MGTGRGGVALRQIDRVFQSGTVADLGDGALLDRFVARRDEAAFEMLVERHGPLVLGVCRRFLRDPNDIDDAFQATLLVLVRHARTLRIEASLGPWLYGVAYRVAIRARWIAAQRRERESTSAELELADHHDDLDRHELPAILDEEVSRLPEKLRVPIVLCYLEGLTHDVAARQLQWPVGTVRSRLARARALLRSRLVRRGWAPSAGILTASVAAREATAAVPRSLTRATSNAAARIAAGNSAAEAVSASVLTLMEGVLTAMITTRLKPIVGTLFVLGVVAAGAAIHAARPARSEASDRPAASRESAPDDSRTTITEIYYVGDLILAQNVPPRGGVVKPRVAVDMAPLIELVTSTVAPGTWVVTDANTGKPTGPSAHPKKKAIGTITPFYLSISLIIRHDPATHEQIADLFRCLRRLMEARDGARDPNAPAVVGIPTISLDDAPASGAPPATPRGHAPRNAAAPRDRKVERMRELIKLLEDEIAALPASENQ